MILVTGASGALAQLVLDRLPPTQVVAASRTPGKVTGYGEVRRLDFDDPSTLAEGFAGADVVLLVSAGQAEDDVVIRRHRAAIEGAERAGVKHIVYTSLVGSADQVTLALTHRWTERRLASSRMQWTILRNGLYAELAVPWAVEASRTGVFDGPMGDRGWAAVAREDLADVTAKVVADAGVHSGKIYELPGASAISGADIANAVAGLTGRRVTYDPVELGQFRAGLTHAGVPPWQVPAIVSSFANIGAGFLGSTHGDLVTLLDGPPRSALEVVTSFLR